MDAVIAFFPVQTKQIEKKTLPPQRQLNCAKQQVICIICAATSPISHLHFPQAWLQLPQASLNQGCENFVHCLQKRNWPIILRKRSRSFVLIDGYDPRHMPKRREGSSCPTQIHQFKNVGKSNISIENQANNFI